MAKAKSKSTPESAASDRLPVLPLRDVVHGDVQASDRADDRTGRAEPEQSSQQHADRHQCDRKAENRVIFLLAPLILDLGLTDLKFDELVEVYLGSRFVGHGC